MKHTTATVSRALLATTLLLAASAPAHGGEVRLSIYFGASNTRASDLRIVQPSRGNDAVFRKVRWLGYSFRFSPYYGVRLSYFARDAARTGLSLDYTHYKVYGQTMDTLKQKGLGTMRP